MRKLVYVLLALCASVQPALAQKVKLCTVSGSHCVVVTLPTKGCKIVREYRVCKR